MTVNKDNDNTPSRDIAIIQNPNTGGCIVTTQQIADTPDIVSQLLDQCTSVTIANTNDGVDGGGAAKDSSASASAADSASSVRILTPLDR